MSRSNRSAAFVVCLAFCAAAAASACAKKPPVTPQGGGAEMPSMGSATSPPPSPTVGMTDESTNPDDGERPQMNAKAKSAYERGMAAWAAGDLAGAKAGFTEATQADPKAYQAFYSLGVIQERMGDPGALNSYRSAQEALQGYEPALVAYGLLLAKKGSLAEADDYLTDKKGRMPKSAAVLAALAEVKSMKKDTGSAQQLAQDALKLRPTYAPAMMTLARDHYRNRRLDLSLYALDAILGSETKEDPNNPPRDKNNAEGWLLRAIIYKEQNRRSLALNAFQKAVQLRPDLVTAKVQLAAYLLESGNATDAKPLLDDALKYNADSLPAHLNRGDALRLLGDIDGAKKEFDWVVSKDANLKEVHYSLALLFLFAPQMPNMDKKQQLQAAIAELEKFQQLRGGVSKAGADDSDQLLTRAKTQLDALNAQEQAAQQAAAASASAAAAASAAPAGSGSGAAPPGSAPAPADSGTPVP